MYLLCINQLCNSDELKFHLSLIFVYGDQEAWHNGVICELLWPYGDFLGNGIAIPHAYICMYIHDTYCLLKINSKWLVYMQSA